MSANLNSDETFVLLKLLEFADGQWAMFSQESEQEGWGFTVEQLETITEVMRTKAVS